MERRRCRWGKWEGARAAGCRRGEGGGGKGGGMDLGFQQWTREVLAAEGVYDRGRQRRARLHICGAPFLRYRRQWLRCCCRRLNSIPSLPLWRRRRLPKSCQHHSHTLLAIPMAWDSMAL